MYYTEARDEHSIPSEISKLLTKNFPIKNYQFQILGISNTKEILKTYYFKKNFLKEACLILLFFIMELMRLNLPF
jgi:hypothetical protein